MSQRPRIGRPLPRASRAYASTEKWTYWILAPDGHGADWRRVFRVGPDDRHVIWSALAPELRRAPVVTLRDRGAHGLVCGVAVRITLYGRTAVVLTSWHYRDESAAPRLVTAYPIV